MLNGRTIYFPEQLYRYIQVVAFSFGFALSGSRFAFNVKDDSIADVVRHFLIDVFGLV